ncbi:hypothetical protein CAPGI0001_1853 [Capnocytophaga gingivalis ATCC 33624]|nr:hypothetical protein CAPGI0001_1853 [Capnocytophaga gingivalis ATCC 33624]
MVLHHLLLMISKILSNSIFPKRKEATLFGQPLFYISFYPYYKQRFALVYHKGAFSSLQESHKLSSR